MPEGDPLYKKFGPNFAVGDWDALLVANSKLYELLATDRGAADEYWASLQADYAERGFTAEEFQELADATAEELAIFRSELEFGVEAFDE